MNKYHIKKFPAVLFLALLLGIAACSNNKNNVPVVGTALDSVTGMHDETQDRLTTVANNAIAEGKTKEALVYYTRLYKSNPTQDVTLNYAQLLRKTGRAAEAVKALSPFVNGRDGTPRGNAKPVMLDEYAAANIETGNYALAEDVLNMVLANRNAARYHADAANLLGLVLDAKNMHREAEKYYRLALAGWKGDPSAVMNNLGLCLAAQGMFDESLTMLRQALIKAPHKEEIAANIQMVSNLRRAVLPTAPISVTSAPDNR